MHKYNTYLLGLSFFVLIVSFFNRNEWSNSLQISDQLKYEPIQTPTTKEAFTVTYNDELFNIKPKFDYELYGLVVSYRLHDSEHGQMIHALNKDHINVADFCVVWGTTADVDILAQFKFSNGQFTCNWQTTDEQAWNKFNQHQISNNHLLASEPNIRATLDDIQIGDQIHLKGQLAHYIGPSGFERGSSVVRTDTGNGACETIWVEQINIISKMSSLWRTLLWLSMGLLALTTFIYLKSPYQPYK